MSGTSTAAIDLADATAALGITERSTPNRSSDSSKSAAEPNQPTVVPELVVSAVRQSVVLVETSTCTGQRSGTGVAIGNGVVLTNRHVIEDSNGVRIVDQKARTIGISIPTASSADDIAALNTAIALRGSAPTPMAGPHHGQAVYIAGHPLGGSLEIRAGHITSTDDGSGYGTEGGTVWHTDVAVEHGNSGSGVFTESGELIGLVFARSNSTGKAVIIPASRLGTSKFFSGMASASCDRTHRGARQT